MRKRMANRWMGTVSVAYNDATKDLTGAPEPVYEDPTCLATSLSNTTFCPPSQQYAPESGGSGIDNVYTNAKWLVKGFRSSTRCRGPVQPGGRTISDSPGVSIPAGHRDPVAREPCGHGYGPARAARRCAARQLPDPGFAPGPRVPRSARPRIIPSVDIFNLSNGNTVLAPGGGIRTRPTPIKVSGIVAPRVMRFGLNVRW